MRIVGGKYRGHGLVAPKGLATRPTTDRTRESLFNILANKVDFDAVRVIDLFAGTGALGLEAVSRGASFCLFVEEAPQPCAAIKTNIQALGVDGSAKLLKLSVMRLGSPAEFERFDLAFLDPPYGKDLGEKAAKVLREHEWLNDGASLVLEEHSKSFPERLNGFELSDLRQFGDTAIGMFQLKN